MTVAKGKVGAARRGRAHRWRGEDRHIPTLITINMSGKLWWPSWMRDPSGAPRDLYSDPTLLRSQALLVETCAGALAGDRVDSRVRSHQRDRRRPAACRAATPAGYGPRCSRPRCGVRRPAYRSSSARTCRPSRPIPTCASTISPASSTKTACTRIRSTATSRRSFLDPELVPFSCALTAELAGHRPRAPHARVRDLHGPARAVPGSPSPTTFWAGHSPQYLASEEEGARYYEEVLERLAATGAAGAYAWCYGDYDPSALRPRAFRHRDPRALLRPGPRRRQREARRRGGAGVRRAPRARGRSPWASPPRSSTSRRTPTTPRRNDHFRRLYDRWLAS